MFKLAQRQNGTPVRPLLDGNAYYAKNIHYNAMNKPAGQPERSSSSVAPFLLCRQANPHADQ